VIELHGPKQVPMIGHGYSGHLKLLRVIKQFVNPVGTIE
jgi:hypothetical protein